MSTSKIDPILLSVFARSFKAITDEMSISMAQTTRSPILCEAKDYVTGLYDADGNMLEQTENLPILAFSLAPVCKYIKAFFGDEIYPGDVIFHNDVFSLGNQNNDVAAFKPVFLDGELVAWTAVKGHQADIGGNVAGGYNPNAVEVWQEALRIPPVKVVERGKLRKDVWGLIFANVRLDIVQHDMKAEMGACTVGERRMLELLRKYGVPSFQAHKQALFEATRKMMEAEIAKIPQGQYAGEGFVYYDGRHPGSKFTVRVDITVGEKHIKFDYSRTDAQTNGFVNGTFTSSASATILTLLQMVNPDIPHNEGMVQPIEIVIPEGTILNAAYPKATTFGNHLCPPNADAIQRALAPVMPERVTAGWNNLLASLTTGIDPRTNEKYVDIGFMGLKGGSGAMRGTDGYDHIGMIDASGGVLDQDYEMFEQQTPHTLIKHELLADSAGAGQWRGGLGVETIFRIGSPDTQLVTFGDGDFEPAFGLFGGKDAGLNFIRLQYPDGQTVVPKNKDLITGVPLGTVYHQVASGGGGYGDPKLRDRSLLAQEIRNGVITPEAAERRDYGFAPPNRECSVEVLPWSHAKSHSSCPALRPPPPPPPELGLMTRPGIAHATFCSVLNWSEGMNFELSPEQTAVRDNFARFCDERIAPQAAALDEARAFPHALFKELAELGFFGMRYPEEVGGSGMALSEFCLALQEVARGSMSLAGAVAMQSLMGTKFLHMLGNADIVERLFKPALRGEKIGGICMTEPNAGSDLGSIATTARKVEGGYLINGQKTWITSAPVADFFTVFAKAGEEKKLTIFLVEKGFTGLTVGREIHKMGVWALPTSEVALDDCFVPDSHRLSREEGDGEGHLRKTLGEIRIITGAMALGVGYAALAEANRYAAERSQFGKPINRFQAIQMKLAEMATSLEAASHLVYSAAWLRDADKPYHQQAAMAKLFASETAASVCDQAARVLASYGYAMEYPVQRYLRDVRFTLIGGGTSEILKMIIAKEMSR